MRKLFLPGFWVSLVGAVGAVVFAAVVSRPFAFVAAGVLACSAVLMASALCWDDLGGKTSLAHLLLGKRAIAQASEADLLVDVRAIQVAGVFTLGRDLLLYLRGGRGTYFPAGTTEANQWPEDGELFLAWKTSERGASAAARQLNAWESTHQPLHLLCAAGRATVLSDADNLHLTLPELSPIGRGRAAHPGRR